ncbi:MAG: hypothetical protein M5U34_43285, partial [Chloroflexi bacterium]|nr:hypothetical protein [Chloroflexota bacterium]
NHAPMSKKTVSIVKKGVIGLALLMLLVSLWPHARSLYDLTGEGEFACATARRGTLVEHGRSSPA